MALENVAPLLAKEFVTVKLDYDRGIGAKDIEKRYIATDQGLPWFVFVDGTGKGLADAQGPQGNVGFPWEPHEIDHFGKMLKKVQHRLTDAEIDFLVKSLQEFRKNNGG